jgi:hypothetical protein
MIVLELVVILAIIALQAWLFWQNRQKAAALAQAFPEKQALRLQPPQQAKAAISRSPLQALQEGQPFQLADAPEQRQRVKGKDGDFWLIEEMPLAGGHPSSYLLSEDELAELPDKPGFSLLSDDQAETSATLPLVPSTPHPSPFFAALLAEVWQFLENSRDRSRVLEAIRDMSRRRLEGEERYSRSALFSPLYLGLLGSLLGLLLSFSPFVADGVDEDTLARFALGAGLALSSSFFGLLFSFLGDRAYRQAQLQASGRLNEWLRFLQSDLLPHLPSEQIEGVNTLQKVLDHFNRDVAEQLGAFKAVFSDLNQYVGLQERFLVSLQQTDFTQLTEANLQFFDQIQQNETLFERFGQYLQRLNEGMATGRDAASDIREIVGQLRQLDDVQGFLRQNEALIRKQLGYLAAHEEKMERLTRGIEQHFIEAGDEIGRLVQRRLQLMQREEQDAGEQLRQHFERLKQENVYQKIADQLQPIRQMEEDVHTMRELFAETLKHLLETQQYLIRKINQDGQTHGRILKEMELLNGHMQQLTERKSWMQRLLGGGR